MDRQTKIRRLRATARFSARAAELAEEYGRPQADVQAARSHSERTLALADRLEAERPEEG